MPANRKLQIDPADLAGYIENQMSLGSSGANGAFGLSGDINVQISAAGIQPAATGSDYVLAVFSLPAASFDVAGRGVNLQVMGTFAANTNSKRAKIYWGCTTAVVGSVATGGTVIADTGTQNTAAAGGGIALGADIFKYGVAGSNTQLGIHQAAQCGNVVGSLLAPAALTANESNNILIAVTGNAAITLSDILFNFLQITAMN